MKIVKHLVLSIFMAVFAFAGSLPEAEAKRMGGGGSFGMNRQIAPQAAPKAPAASPQQNVNRQNQAASPASRSWMGPIAGLAAGLGLAALFSHLGLGEELASFLMLAILAVGAVMLFRMFTRRAAAPASGGLRYAAQGAEVSAGQLTGGHTLGAGASSPSASLSKGGRESIAADFDADAFARQAKVQFIRLQAAHDEGNLDDIRSFTTPEVFAEIRMQMSERIDATQTTDIVSLDAQVLEATEEDTRYVVSIAFSGMLREQPGAAPIDFDEIWHMTKPISGDTGWVIAGIQQRQ